MMVLSIPKSPDASPETKIDAASTHSSAVTRTSLACVPMLFGRESLHAKQQFCFRVRAKAASG